jgi:hypothetical protein
MLVGALSLVCSVTVMILFAARRGDGVHMAYAHMGIAVIMAIGFAATFIKANTALRASGANQSAIAALTSRFVSYVWTWGALCLLTVYATGILVWREWLTFSIACIVIAGLSMVFATMLQKDADAGREDATLLKLADALAKILLAGMAITVVGFIIDGKMVRFLNPRFTDWAANNVFFFGAISVAAITGYALKVKNSRT